MRKSVKLAVAAAMVLGSTSAFATNGSTLIGLGAKSRGMAGTAIGVSHGAESALANPAFITTIEKDHEVSFGGTLFMPNVKNAYGTGADLKKSDADTNVIPEVSIAAKITDGFYMGVGIWGTAGMGVDYRDEAYQANMVTNLQIMQFGVPLAYTTNGFSIALTPILQYGALDINYKYNHDGNNSTPTVTGNTQGVSQDLQFGWNIGLSYEISDFTIGAVYKSQIDMTYKGQISAAMQDFGVSGISDKLSTPAEYGLGASYKFGEHTIALDWKQIKWSSAEGYKEFKWEDQDVIAIGYAYTTKGWAVRLGYNYAKSPIKEQTVGSVPADYRSALDNMLNLLGFPGIVESHYAIGGTYNVSDVTSFDLAFTYAPEVTQTFEVPYGSSAKTDMTTKHSQTGVSAQVNFAF